MPSVPICNEGDLSDGLVFDAVRIRLLEIGEAVKALPPRGSLHKRMSPAKDASSIHCVPLTFWDSVLPYRSSIVSSTHAACRSASARSGSLDRGPGRNGALTSPPPVTVRAALRISSTSLNVKS